MPQGGIPRTIKIGDVEYNVADHPELLSLVESARKEEKDKLYGSINSMKAEIDKFKAGATEAEKKDTEYKEKLKKMQEDLTAKTDELKKFEGIDPNKKPETPPKDKGEVSEEVKKLQEQLAKTEKEANERIAKIEREAQAKSLADYRKAKLVEHAGKIIDDFVPDNLTTTEDIDKYVTDALDKSKKYIREEYTKADGTKVNATLEEIQGWEEEKKKNPPTPPTAGTPTYVPPVVPPTGGGQANPEELMKDIKGMSPEQFAKNRDQLRAQIRQQGLEGTEE